MIQDEVQKLAEKRLTNLDELLTLSDKLARGEGTPKREQFNFLKLSIDSTLKMIERFMPIKTEQSGELLLRIASDEKGVYLEPPQIPVGVPLATNAV